MLVQSALQRRARSMNSSLGGVVVGCNAYTPFLVLGRSLSKSTELSLGYGGRDQLLPSVIHRQVLGMVGCKGNKGLSSHCILASLDVDVVGVALQISGLTQLTHSSSPPIDSGVQGFECAKPRQSGGCAYRAFKQKHQNSEPQFITDHFHPMPNANCALRIISFVQEPASIFPSL